MIKYFIELSIGKNETENYNQVFVKALLINVK